MNPQMGSCRMRKTPDCPGASSPAIGNLDFGQLEPLLSLRRPKENQVSCSPSEV